MGNETHQSTVAISQRGVEFISQWEGFSSKPYRDGGGVPTIGYGATHYPDGRRVTMMDKPITKEEGIALLKDMLVIYEEALNALTVVPLNQAQYDALMSFIYNVGITQFERSTLRKLLNDGRYYAAAQELTKWVKDNGKTVNGLVRRRKAEKELFLKG